ncbi:MAG: hypothetical protein ABI791_04475 [Acidobacteriota bacterium]
MKVGLKSQTTIQTEGGGALIMSILITFLLGIACIGMLSAVTASSREGTDVLSSTKAYYAAESGIQASVNALRYGSAAGGPVSYITAVNGFANSGQLDTLPNSPLFYTNCNGDMRVLIGGDCSNSYKITVRDPDNSQSALTFATSGAQFRVVNSDGTVGAWGAPTRTFGTGGTMTTLEWFPNATNPTPITFDADNPTQTALIGSFRLTSGGTAMNTATDFKVFYSLAVPGNPGWLISGRIAASGAVTILSAKYTVTGSDIVLCNNSINCGTVTAAAELPIYGLIKPKEPTRLLVTATGFGPNRSKKVLEAVLQKSPLDGANSSSPFSMNGPCFEPGNPTNVAVFQAGTSNSTTYSGASSGGILAPAFGFNSPCNLTTANAWIANHLTPNGQNQPPQVSPPPAYFDTSQLPEWQRSPLQMEEKVQLYRTQAQYSGTYRNPASSKITNPGYVTGQTGQITTVTFCEGDCTVDGDNGGGILVVTGKLTSLGGFGFKGLILVTGPNGWERAGGGCGSIIGNVVISPYTASNLATNAFTLPPKYQITGGGCSGVTYASLDDLFEGENSTVTNFIRGVAEK